jgi:hypothetical protein
MPHLQNRYAAALPLKNVINAYANLAFPSIQNKCNKNRCQVQHVSPPQIVASNDNIANKHILTQDYPDCPNMLSRSEGSTVRVLY